MRSVVLAGLAYIALTVALAWPLVVQSNDHVGADPRSVHTADVILNVYVHAWTGSTLFSAPSRLFDPPLFHPATNVLATTMSMLGHAPEYALLWRITDNPVLSFNLLTLASFPLSALAMFLLLRSWSGSAMAGFLAGLAFGLAAWRWTTIGAPQMPPLLATPRLLHVQLLPIILLLLDRVADRATWPRVLATAAVIALQGLYSFYLGYMAFVAIGSYLIADVAFRGFRGRLREAAGLAMSIVGGGAAVAIAALPHAMASGRGAISEQIIPEAQRLLEPFYSYARLTDVMVGWPLFVLGLCGVCAPAGSVRSRVRRCALMLTVVFGYILARGSYGVPLLGDLPVRALSELVPGFQNIRVSARFAILLTLGFSALAGFAVQFLESQLSARRPRLLTPVAAALALLLLVTPVARSRPIDLVPLPPSSELGDLHDWLAANGDGGPLLELPRLSGAAEPIAGAKAAYRSLFHGLPILTGHTGYPPQLFRELRPLFASLPDETALQTIVDCTGVRWITDTRTDTAQSWKETEGVELVNGFETPTGSALLLRVRARPSAPCSLGAAPKSGVAGRSPAAKPQGGRLER